MMENKKIKQALRIGLAVVILGLISGFGLARYTQIYLSDAALFKATYVPPQSVGPLSGEVSNFATGFNAFDKKDYATAIPILEAIPVGDVKYQEARFYLGHSYLATGNYDASVVAFNQVLAYLNTPFAQNAAWHYLLAMLGSGKTDDRIFKMRLRNLARLPSSAYADNAKALQDKLGHVLRRIFL